MKSLNRGGCPDLRDAQLFLAPYTNSTLTKVSDQMYNDINNKEFCNLPLLELYRLRSLESFLLQ